MPEMPRDLPAGIADVSVVMPAYRSAATVGPALAGIAAQTVKPRQVIVVDDGSDDGTYEAALAMTDGMAPIELTVLRQENKGAGAARNAAFAVAKGEYIAFLDSDDRWTPEKLERSLSQLVGSGHALVAHDYARVEPDGTERPVACAERFRAAADPYRDLYRKGTVGSSTVLTRTAAIRAVGGMDETLPTAQDFDLWLKLLASPDATFLIFDGAYLLYTVSDAGITGNTERRIACTLRVARRHLPALRAHGGGLSDFLFRIVAIHVEAMSAYRRRGRLGMACWTAARLLARLPWGVAVYAGR